MEIKLIDQHYFHLLFVHLFRIAGDIFEYEGRVPDDNLFPLRESPQPLIKTMGVRIVLELQGILRTTLRAHLHHGIPFKLSTYSVKIWKILVSGKERDLFRDPS